MIAIFNPFYTFNIETLTALIDVKQSESTFMDYAQAEKKIEDFKESEDKQMINYILFDPHNMDCMSYFEPQNNYKAVELQSARTICDTPVSTAQKKEEKDDEMDVHRGDSKDVLEKGNEPMQIDANKNKKD